MTVNIDASPTEAEIVMTHTLDAPREVVWTVFTDPKHVVNWYGGNQFSNPVCEMDVRPGGQWRHVMRTPDGAEHSLLYVFVEVVKPEKLSWQDVNPGTHAEGPLTCLNTLTLEEYGRKTKSRFVARFRSIAERDMAVRSGFSAILREGVARMEQVVKGVTS